MLDTPKKYLSFLDILRLVAMLAIITFHSTEFIFFSDVIVIKDKTFLYRYLHEYARWLPYSGHYIILISFFLIGYTGKIYKNLSSWVIIFFSVHIMILLAFHEGPLTEFKFEWDIYPFLAISFFILSILQRINYQNWKLLLISSVFFLIIPTDFWKISPKYPIVKMIFTGHCDAQNLGAWPIFPWIGLPLFSLSLGKISNRIHSHLLKMNLREALFWSVGIVLSVLGIYHYHLPLKDSFPIGKAFYCFILNRPILEFWSSFFPFIFFIRLSFIIKKDFSLKKLSWNNNFALTYIYHLAILSLGVLFENLFKAVPYTFDFFILVIIFGSEFLERWTRRWVVQYAHLK